MDTVYIVLLLGPYLEGTDSAGTVLVTWTGPAATKLTLVGLRSKCDFFVPFNEESLENRQWPPLPSDKEPLLRPPHRVSLTPLIT